MRIDDILEEGKRRKKKLKSAAYGPGAFGTYGIDSGYSGVGEDRKFTDLEIAIMEGGGSIEDDKVYYLRQQLKDRWASKNENT